MNERFMMQGQWHPFVTFEVEINIVNQWLDDIFFTTWNNEAFWVCQKHFQGNKTSKKSQSVTLIEQLKEFGNFPIKML